MCLQRKRKRKTKKKVVGTTSDFIRVFFGKWMPGGVGAIGNTNKIIAVANLNIFRMAREQRNLLFIITINVEVYTKLTNSLVLL